MTSDVISIVFSFVTSNIEFALELGCQSKITTPKVKNVQSIDLRQLCRPIGSPRGIQRSRLGFLFIVGVFVVVPSCDLLGPFASREGFSSSESEDRRPVMLLSVGLEQVFRDFLHRRLVRFVVS